MVDNYFFFNAAKQGRLPEILRKKKQGEKKKMNLFNAKLGKRK